MTRLITIAVLLWSTTGLWAQADVHHHNALKALEAKDFPAALTQLEAALTAEPDSLQYGSEYRQTVIQANAYDRCIAFFEKLVADHPSAANAFLNFGFSYVDKIPASGTITQVILANTALSHFTKSIELAPSWIAYYTRGNSYLFWPKVFGRTPLGLADLEKAMEMQNKDSKRSYHVRAYVSLGDAYWKMDDLEKAKSTWQAGLQLFPESAALRERLAREGAELQKYIEDQLDPNKRVDTNLQEIWTNK